LIQRKLPLDYIISTVGLRRTFDDITAVYNLDLQVPPGTIYGFLGPNGSGKTTTIKMLLGLLRPDFGEVRLFEKSPFDDATTVLRRVGAMVEVPSLYGHLSGRENLEITRRLIGVERAAIDRVLELVGMTHAADRKTKGYSLGMKQRLSLALAMVHEPDLLILDEPTNGLDPAGIREMRELIARLPRETGVTIFLSSHLLNEVEQVATHVGIISNGELRFQGTLEELHRRQLLALQVRVSDPETALRLVQAELWPDAGLSGGYLSGPIDSPEIVPRINRLLVENGYDVHQLDMNRPTLESMFLDMTTTRDAEKEVKLWEMS